VIGCRRVGARAARLPAFAAALTASLFGRPLAAQGDSAAQSDGAAQADSAPPPHVPTSYDIVLVDSDTGAHFVGEVQTGWRLASDRPVGMKLDSALRVVRVLVDGRPNTRISRTMYGRGGNDVVVPHQNAAGDTLSTRVRYHGIPRGGLRVGSDRAGARALAAETAGGRASLWLPVPESGEGRVTVAWHVQALAGQRVVANGTLTRVDTLAYGHTTWHFALDMPVPLTSLAVVAGRFAVTTLPRGTCPDPCAPVTLWTPPDDSGAAASGPFRRAGEIADYMSARLGPLPYPGLAHVSSPLPPAGRPGASIVLYDGAQVHAGTITEQDIARATAAQWLGNAVDEAGLDQQGPSDAAAAYLAWLWTRDAAGGHAPGGVMLTRGVDAFRRLHRTVGDSAFFRGLRRYVDENRHATAAPGALERAMAEAAGRRLDWTFDRARTTR
jgi:aminopeptidase N